MLTRRDAILFSLATALTGVKRKATAASAIFGRTQYEHAMIIDGNGGLGGFDPSAPDKAPLSPQFVADAGASGVTAMNVSVSEVGNASDVFNETLLNIASLEHELTAHPDIFLKVLRARDLTEAKTTRRLGLIYGFQDTSMLGADLSRLTMFYDLGVRISQPTYNQRNLVGDGCLETSDGGLSRFGHDFVQEMNRLHMVLDLSHGSPRTIADGIMASTAPAIISHTGCRTLVDLARNTYDTSLKSLADRGGVAGIYFMPFLRASGQPHADDLFRHLKHAVNICGEEHVGVGTDVDLSGERLDHAFAQFQRQFFEKRVKAGIVTPGEAPEVFNLIPEYNDPRRFENLADDLSHRGWSGGRIEKVLGRNFARLFAEVWSS
jgi:membrane dipeptidase